MSLSHTATPIRSGQRTIDLKVDPNRTGMPFQSFGAVASRYFATVWALVGTPPVGMRATSAGSGARPGPPMAVRGKNAPSTRSSVPTEPSARTSMA